MDVVESYKAKSKKKVSKEETEETKEDETETEKSVLNKEDETETEDETAKTAKADAEIEPAPDSEEFAEEQISEIEKKQGFRFSKSVREAMKSEIVKSKTPKHVNKALEKAHSKISYLEEKISKLEKAFEGQEVFKNSLLGAFDVLEPKPVVKNSNPITTKAASNSVDSEEIIKQILKSHGMETTSKKQVNPNQGYNTMNGFANAIKKDFQGN